MCQEVAYPPVIACENQHILCAQCALDVVDAQHLNNAEEPATCPTCREILDDELETCIVGTRILQGLRVRPYFESVAQE